MGNAIKRIRELLNELGYKEVSYIYLNGEASLTFLNKDFNQFIIKQIVEPDFEDIINLLNIVEKDLPKDDYEAFQYLQNKFNEV